MNRNISKILYDKKSKVLSIAVKKIKSADSDIYGNIVIDYDKRGGIVRINFYDFNFKNFGDNRKLLKDFSKNLKIPLLVK